jgi:hypothetical protein
MRALFVACCLALLVPQQAAAWGQEGHSIVAEIAQRRLDSGILSKIKSLLGGEIALASLASFADDYRSQRDESRNWHFVNIPLERSTYEPDPDCKKDPKFGDCIINAIERARQVLAACANKKEDRVEALKILVHFIGDIHQPLHTADRAGDHGGNDVMVTFFGQSTKLHALWDTGLIMHTVYAWGSYVTRLDEQWFPGRDLTGLDGGKPVDWALEAHRFAQTVVYDFPDDRILETNYYDKSLPVLDRQLAVAGLRLARFLTETLQPTQCP